MNEFIILDPSLKSFNGHFLTYDNAIAVASKQYDFTTTVLASSTAIDLPCDFKLIPTFRYELEDSFIRLPALSNLTNLINKKLIHQFFLNDLGNGIQQVEQKKDLVIYLHTTTHYQIPPLVKWVKTNRKLNPTVFVMLRYSPSPNPYYPLSGDFNKYRAAIKYLEESGVSKHFRLIVDSDLLKEEYSLMTYLPISLVPIPHTMSAELYNIDTNKNQPKLLTYLGNARSTKGFQYLPHLVADLREELISGKWSAEFQSNVMFLRDKESVVSVALMRGLPVKLIERELSIIEYEDLLKRSSLVLIPYQLLYYHSQTSGIFCEALGAGKPVVVPRGTWMAKQLKSKNIGETFYPGDRISFTKATKIAMKKIDELTDNAKNYREEWVGYHNPNNFFKSLLELL